MKIEVTQATFQEKAILRNLMQLYLYDFSEMDGNSVGDSGLFDYRYLDLYWTEPDRYPFLVRVDGQLAGFALLRRGTYFSEQEALRQTVMMVSEFFVMRKFRRLDVGSQVARLIFDRFPGRWEIAQKPENKIGKAFWRALIAGYTKGDYREVFLDNAQWHGPVQVFDNSNFPVK
jgi:predicted acetyltransferase